MLTFDNGYSPVLSALTAAFELGVAGWALTGPGRKDILRPIAVLCSLLAGYQVLEIVVCSNPAATGWARLGFLDVLWLPPTGLWLLSRYQPSARLGRLGAQASFFIAGALAVWVATSEQFVSGTVCQSVFATYFHNVPGSALYGGTYSLGCLILICWGMWQAANLADPILRKHAAEMALGNAAFMLLALLTQVAIPSLDLSQPSLMCHYALILAMLLSQTVRREKALARGEL